MLKSLTWTIAAAATAILATATTVATASVGATDASPAITAKSTLKVVGNHLETTGGRTVRLIGVQRMGLSYKCLYDRYFDGPHSPESVATMKAWNINAVRVDLNENCWLDVHGVALGGAGYRTAVKGYVKTLRTAGLFVILDDHVSSDGKLNDVGLPMPGRQATKFWRSVSSTFRNTPGMVFDLYNEPHVSTWKCWRDGCSVPAGSDGEHHYAAYSSAGMQDLVSAVRAGGSSAPIMLGGLDFALDDSGWAAHKPTDPLGQLVVAVHDYGPVPNQFENNCLTDCRADLTQLAKTHPVVFGELGQYDCKSDYTVQHMEWADAHDMSYLAFTWNSTESGWKCGGGPALIKDYDGTPTTYGKGVKAHFLSVVS